MSNRLSLATSPYLLQHADNPIDWWEWSDEAFAEAQRRDVPIMLSVGYAACHWCHVMAHESFEDPATAAEVNANFVAIKVDREERPDIDAVYMAATQAMTGQGGWPMTCFLTPIGEPFHCGTYYPPTSRHGMPGFRQLLDAVTRAWTEDGERVRGAAADIASRLAGSAAAELPSAVVGESVLDDAVATLAGDVDATFGGFGGAPKFPPSMVLEFLLRHYERTGSAPALRLVELTCERMAQWVVPHFEKMLYDNALLLRVYAHLARRTRSPLARRVAEETAEFLLRDLRTAEGGFASALDADTNGVEGLTYAWTPAQLAEVLTPADAAWAAELFEVTAQGTFEHGSSTLQLPADPDDPERWERLRTVLFAARSTRPQPGRDDKVITAWNGMAIQALAEAGAAFGRLDWVAAAGAAADLLLDLHVVEGRVRRSSRDGTVGTAAGVLEDHAYLADALLALHQATGDPERLAAATRILDLALARFADPDRPGTFFDTADDAEALLHRPREFTDNATPSGASALCNALLTASVLAEPEAGARYREAAEAGLATVGGIAGKHPRFAGHWLTAAEAMVSGPLQVALVGPVGDPEREALLAQARLLAPGGAVVVPGEPDAAGVPLLAGRPLIGSRPAAYVCRGFVCDLPATTPTDLAAQLAR
jgi:uncharacterized protein YyaL (SSP411 family)